MKGTRTGLRKNSGMQDLLIAQKQVNWRIRRGFVHPLHIPAELRIPLPYQHFVPQLFIEKGFKAYNYGMSGARLQESALMLQLMIDKGYSFKNIILEIDLNINSEGHSEGTRARFMPFLKSHATVSNYYKAVIPEFNSLYYLPFYRYIKYDSQIGFREMFFSAIQKPSASILNEGFYALQGEGKNMKYDLTKYAPKKNKDYEFIKKLCQSNGINLIVVSTPMCENTKGINYFEAIKKVYPEVHNYENAVIENKYYGKNYWNRPRNHQQLCIRYGR